MGGVDDLAVLARFERGMRLRGDGQIDQVMVMIDPDVQDGLQLHLAGRWVVGPDLVSRMQTDNGLLAMTCLSIDIPLIKSFGFSLRKNNSKINEPARSRFNQVI